MREGSDIFLLSYRYGCMTGVTAETARGNIREEGFIFPGVKEDGSVNDIQVDPQVYYKSVSSFEPYVFDASFLKLRELGITYRFPKKSVGLGPGGKNSPCFVCRKKFMADILQFA